MLVSAKTDSKKLAGFIARDLKFKLELVMIGAGALNQAIKAIIIAKGYLASSGYTILVSPSFTNVTVEGAEKSGIRLIIEKINA